MFNSQSVKADSHLLCCVDTVFHSVRTRFIHTTHSCRDVNQPLLTLFDGTCLSSHRWTDTTFVMWCLKLIRWCNIIVMKCLRHTVQHLSIDDWHAVRCIHLFFWCTLYCCNCCGNSFLLVTFQSCCYCKTFSSALSSFCFVIATIYMPILLCVFFYVYCTLWCNYLYKLFAASVMQVHVPQLMFINCSDKCDYSV